MATRTSVATDNFNRAAPLGANWTNINFLTGGTPSISASTVFYAPSGAPAGGQGTVVWAGTGTFTNDHYSSLKLVAAGFGSVNYGVGVICRASTDTDSGRDYYMHFAGSDNVSVLSKVVNGTYTQIATASVTWATNDRVELECVGTSIVAMKNGVAIGGAMSATDSSLTTGKPGICAASDASAVATGDDWEGGSLASGTSSTPTIGAASIAGIAPRNDRGIIVPTDPT